MSKDILVRDSYSGDHFEKEIKCNMTDLAQIIQQCGDTVFKVKFKKRLISMMLLKELRAPIFQTRKL